MTKVVDGGFVLDASGEDIQAFVDPFAARRLRTNDPSGLWIPDDL